MTPFHLLAFATSFAMVGVCTALALQSGSNPLTVVAVRTLLSLALLGAWFAWIGLSLKLPRRDLKVALAIGIPLSINNYMINVALGEIPVPLVVLIFYLWPAITTAAAWALGTERFRWRAAAGLAAAFVGVGLAVNVEFTAAQAKGVWLAAGASVMWSATYLLIGHFFHGRDTRVPTFYMMLTALAVFVALLAATGAVALPATALGWTGLAGMGLFYAFALIGLFAAMKHGASRASFYMNFEPVASVILAALLLGQTLAPVQLAGAALVIAALCLFRPPPHRSAPASPSRRS